MLPDQISGHVQQTNSANENQLANVCWEALPRNWFRFCAFTGRGSWRCVVFRGRLRRMAKMRRRIGVVTHGTSGYRQGCRCDVCKEAESARNAHYRVSGTTKSKVLAMPSQPGEVERAVIEEAEIHCSTGYRVVTARTLARVLDNPNMAGVHVSTARQLVPILNAMHDSGPGKRKGSARLALVSDMAKSRRPK